MVGRRAVVWTPLLCKFVVSTRDLIIFNVILTILLFYLQPVGGVKEHNSEFWGNEPLRGVICTDKGTPGQKHTSIRQSLSSLLCANTSAVRQCGKNNILDFASAHLWDQSLSPTLPPSSPGRRWHQEGSLSRRGSTTLRRCGQGGGPVSKNRPEHLNRRPSTWWTRWPQRRRSHHGQRGKRSSRGGTV